MATSPNYGGALQPFVAQLQNSDSTNKVAIATAGSTPRKISALSASSTDTADKTLNLYVTSGGVDYLICTILIPLTSGNSATIPAVNLLASANWTWFEYDAAGNKVFVLPASAVLKMAAVAQLTSAKIIAVCGNGQDFT